MEQIVAGLDIGTTKIVCLVGRRTIHGKVEIMGIGKSNSDGVSRGVVSNIKQTVESIRSAVEEAEKMAGVKIKTVNVGIAGQHIRSIQNQGVRMRDSMDEEISQVDIDKLVEDMHRLVMKPGEEIIHVIPQEYTVDNEQGIKDPVGMSGMRLEANCHVVVGQVSAAKNIKRCVENANLEIKEMILEPLASSESVLTEEEKEAGVVLVDIGGGTTDIAIFQDGTIRHTAVIPFGGNIITEDIKSGCSILKQQAELLKVRFGSAIVLEDKEAEVVSIPGFRGQTPKEISVKNLSYIINARVTEIVDQVFYEIKNTVSESQLIAGIVITGGGAQLKHISQLFAFRTGMDSRLGMPNGHMSATEIEGVVSPSNSTGLGLVLKGFLSTTNMGVAHQEEKVEEPKVANHSEKRKGNFFNKVFRKGMELFEDDNE
ncbi:MAG: cell division protein FtsA [Sphingobacteriales bacterium]|jgi:cell division protein FtsA